MPDFLLEIGLEEVPARMIEDAEADLALRTVTMLERQQLLSEAVLTEGTASCVKRCSTPRRLAVLVHGVLEQQPDITEETIGPAVKIAFKDGQPTPAAEAFARKAGIAVADLRTITTPKGDYLAATTIKKGRTAAEVLAAELPKEIAAIYWPKSMYWREHKPERFVRPVLWLACLLGEEIVPLTFAGRTAARATYGHRVLHGDAPITITAPATYLTQLESAYVLADPELRRQKIRKALDKVTREIPNARWREDEALVDSVTHLTEWPDVLLGNFEPAYLTLPEEVLVTVMRDHQKYFAVESQNDPGAPGPDSRTRESQNPLAPHFLTVTNIALTDENTPIIRQGNERVLRARFNDARFFWEFDQRVSLTERVKLLSNLTFHTKLGLNGSYAAKLERLEKLTGDLVHLPESDEPVPVISNVDDVALARAVQLSKSDLTTELVKEFTELQGQIGGLYAQSQGESPKVGKAIYDQYLPKFFGDNIPSTLEGAILAIADRADTISGMFAVSLEPTGSRDPLALRRAANGIIQILAENQNINRSLSFIAKRACAAYGSQIVTLRAAEQAENGSSREIDRLESNVLPIDQVALSSKVSAFLSEQRLEFYLREAKGQAYDVVKAVLAAGDDDVPDAIARAEAVTAMRGSVDFLAVCTAFKRMKNIVAQAEAAGFLSMTVQQYPTQPIIQPPAQIALNNAVFQVSQPFADFCAARQYTDALKLLATLRPQVDAFLDPKTGVRVMDDEPYIRETRLNLLQQILKNFSAIADFSEIVTTG